MEIEKCLRPSNLYGVEYDPVAYIDELTSICDRLNLTDILASILVEHKMYHNALNDPGNQQRYVDYWKINSRWSSTGVIESYMNPEFDLHNGMEDFCVLLERVGLILKTQADTERVVKIQRKIKCRFANYNEMKETKGKRDRANQEIFLHENSISMAELPLKELNQEWLKHHLPSVKKNSRGKKIAISNFHKNDMSTTKFLHK